MSTQYCNEDSCEDSLYVPLQSLGSFLLRSLIVLPPMSNAPAPIVSTLPCNIINDLFPGSLFSFFDCGCSSPDQYASALIVSRSQAYSVLQPAEPSRHHLTCITIIEWISLCCRSLSPASYCQLGSEARARSQVRTRDRRHGVGLRKIAAGRVPHCCTHTVSDTCPMQLVLYSAPTVPTTSFLPVQLHHLYYSAIPNLLLT